MKHELHKCYMRANVYKNHMAIDTCTLYKSIQTYVHTLTSNRHYIKALNCTFGGIQNLSLYHSRPHLNGDARDSVYMPLYFTVADYYIYYTTVLYENACVRICTLPRRMSSFISSYFATLFSVLLESVKI